jgi:hypothetical protein
LDSPCEGRVFLLGSGWSWGSNEPFGEDVGIDVKGGREAVLDE